MRIFFVRALPPYTASYMHVCLKIHSLASIYHVSYEFGRCCVQVVGSSTACIAALDYDLEQLTFSNIGDCGVVVLRHIDSDVAGYMREKQTPRHLRK